MALHLAGTPRRHAGPAESASSAGTETEGPRTDQHGRRESRTTTGTDTTTATGADSRTDSRPAAHLPGRERHEGPERIHPRQHQHSRTAGGPPHHGRTGGPPAQQTDRQTPSAAKGPKHLDTGKHMDSIGNSRAEQQQRTQRAAATLPDAKREEQGKQQEPRKNLQALFSQASKDSRGPSEARPRRRLRSAPTLYIE